MKLLAIILITLSAISAKAEELSPQTRYLLMQMAQPTVIPPYQPGTKTHDPNFDHLNYQNVHDQRNPNNSNNPNQRR